MRLRSTVLITCASTGSGAVYADRFARLVHGLVLVARDASKLEQRADRLRREADVAVDVVQADLTDEQDLKRVESRVREDERIGVLVNNAGALGELVDAALIGFDRPETVTIPPLPDAAQWSALEAARQAMLPNFVQTHAAERHLPAA
jgi:short-subunit dehydrogenase